MIFNTSNELNDDIETKNMLRVGIKDGEDIMFSFDEEDSKSRVI